MNWEKAPQLMRFLAYNTQEISLIQLDVEGHEIIALKGAMQTIKRYHPTLIVEGWPEKMGEIDSFMMSIGYEKIRRVNSNYVYRPFFGFR